MIERTVWKSLVVPLTVIALVVTACGGGGSGGQGGRDDPIKIAHIGALTGTFAVLGAQESEGIQAYVDYINDNGGILGRQVELIEHDDGSDPQRTAQLVQQVAAEDVAMILAGSATPTAIQAVQTASRLRVPVVSMGATWPPGEVDAEALEWSWPAAVPISAGFEVTKEYYEKQGWDTVALIGANSPLIESSKAALIDQGLDVIRTETYQPGSTQITAQVSASVDAGADVVYCFNSGADQVPCIQGVRDYDPDIALGMNGGNTTGSSVEAIGEDALQGVNVYTFTAQAPDSLTGKARDANDAYFAGMEAAGFDPDGGASNAVIGWAGMEIVAAALEEAEGTEPEDVKRAMDTQEVVTAFGTWERTPDDHSNYSQNGYVTVVFEDGVWQLVHPRPAA